MKNDQGNAWSTRPSLFLFCFLLHFKSQEETNLMGKNHKVTFYKPIYIIHYYNSVKLYIDPRGQLQSRPGSDHYSHTECPSVRLHVSKLQNQATLTAGRDCGLAKWIIDDSCLVFSYIFVYLFLFIVYFVALYVALYINIWCLLWYHRNFFTMIIWNLYRKQITTVRVQ